MSTLGYKQTKDLIFFVLNHVLESRVRVDLYLRLQQINSDETEFYAGVVEHGLYMKLTSEQWFILLSRLPTRLLRSELPLRKILSPRQLKELPPPIG